MNTTIIRFVLCMLSLCWVSTSGATLPDTLTKPRYWTSQTGKKVAGKFINVENGWVILENRQHESFGIKLDNLVTEDAKLVIDNWIKEGHDQSALFPPLPPPPPKSDWHYSETKDSMSDGTISTAWIRSVDRAYFSFPYDGGSDLTFELRNHPRLGRNIILRISKGQFHASSVSVRLDSEKAVTRSCSQPNDGSTDVLFISNDSRFISDLKKAKKMIIEAEFWRQGLRTFEFNCANLKWSHW